MAHIMAAETRNAVSLMKHVLAMDNKYVEHHKRFMWTCTLEVGAMKILEANAPQVMERMKAEFAKKGHGLIRYPVKNKIHILESGSHCEGLVSCSMLTGSAAPDLDQIHINQTFNRIDVGRWLFPVPDLPEYYRIPGCDTNVSLGLIGSRPQMSYNDPYTGALTYTTINGPASTLTTTGQDVTVDTLSAIKLTFWPPEADNWIHRSRTWPPLTVVKDILSQPSFLVPRRSSPDPEHREEWCLSFTLAESIIARTMPHAMRMTYFFFKTIFKCSFNFKVNFRSAEGVKLKEFGSYLAKTTMMWACEVLDPSVWTEGNLQINLSYLFRSLFRYLKQKFLPHYFIPGLNLLRNTPPDLYREFEIRVDRVRLVTAPLTCLPDPGAMRRVFRKLYKWVWQDRAMIHTALMLRQLMELGPPTDHDVLDDKVSSDSSAKFAVYVHEKSQKHVFDRISASSYMDDCFDWITPEWLSLDVNSASEEFLNFTIDHSRAITQSNFRQRKKSTVIAVMNCFCEFIFRCTCVSTVLYIILQLQKRFPNIIFLLLRDIMGSVIMLSLKM